MVGIVQCKLSVIMPFHDFSLVFGFFISGSGKGLTTNAAIIVLTHHFKETRLGLAIGVSFVVMGISGIVAPQLVVCLLHNFSLRVIGWNRLYLVDYIYIYIIVFNKNSLYFCLH